MTTGPGESPGLSEFVSESVSENADKIGEMSTETNRLFPALRGERRRAAIRCQETIFRTRVSRSTLLAELLQQAPEIILRDSEFQRALLHRERDDRGQG